MQAADSSITTGSTTLSRRRMVRIQPTRGLLPIDVGELWRYRELSRFFLVRDVRTRYRQTFLGPAWAILRPLMSIVIFSAIFGGLAGIKPGSDIPYPLFVAPGVLAMGYFSSAVTGSTSSLISSGGLLSKVYFPRLYAPLAAALTPIVDLVLSLVVIFGLFVYFDRVPSWRLVFLPAFLALAAVTGLGFGLLFAGLAVRYRDVMFAVPYGLQIWQYLTPVIYPLTFIPSEYRWLLALNPLTAVVAGFRWSILGSAFGDTTVLYASLGLAFVVLVAGLFVFRRTERTIVDMI